jgi:hypothetical protein
MQIYNNISYYKIYFQIILKFFSNIFKNVAITMLSWEKFFLKKKAQCRNIEPKN